MKVTLNLDMTLNDECRNSEDKQVHSVAVNAIAAAVRNVGARIASEGELENFEVPVTYYDNSPCGSCVVTIAVAVSEKELAHQAGYDKVAGMSWTDQYKYHLCRADKENVDELSFEEFRSKTELFRRMRDMFGNRFGVRG